MQNLNLEILTEDGSARVTNFSVNGKKIETPIFMPVATRGSIKGLHMNMMRALNFNILLCNTYHLMLGPGDEVIKNNGGLKNFINWDSLILTDSGGFQGWSLKAKSLDKGIEIKSVYDGSNLLLTPENTINTQNNLGSDIAMVLDDITNLDVDRNAAIDSINKTYTWAKESKSLHNYDKQALFGIVQGGLDLELRKMSSEMISELEFNGLAIGGLALGESIEERNSIVEICNQYTPKDVPKYAMGVGDILSMLELIERGIDMFDSVWPTRLARHGKIITGNNKCSMTHVNLGNHTFAKHKF